MTRAALARSLALLAGLTLLAACNTVEGIGKDIQKAGQALENASDKGRR